MGRISRSFYKPHEGEEGIYLHAYNHCVENSRAEFPFGDVEKEMFLRHLRRLSNLYTIECLSAVCMSNHFHCIVYIPLRKYSPQEMAHILTNYKKGKDVIDATDEYCLRRAEVSNDISHFMKELQRGFTHWYNKSRDFTRRGTLWEQRFRCVKLIGDEAVATCLQYIELNPVRAGICEDPGDYRFSTYGIWQQSGRHPFAKSFCEHMSGILRPYLATENLKGLARYFRGRYAGIVAGDRAKNMLEVDAAVAEAKVDPTVVNLLMRKSRFYIDSVVIGSKIVLQEQARQLWGDEKAQRKKFGHFFEASTGVDLLGMRRFS
jgi:putative transposase